MDRDNLDFDLSTDQGTDENDLSWLSGGPRLEHSSPPTFSSHDQGCYMHS